jgi:signal transduction histidine kinase
MISFRTVHGRLFWVLAGVALVPVTLVLLAGALVFREFVVTTGTAGAWDQVAASGRELLEEVEELPTPPAELRAAADRHREGLAESVRFSRLYSFLGERVLVLLPALALFVFVLACIVALVTAGWLARSFADPVEELVRWTERLGAGAPLPARGTDGSRASGGRGELKEFLALREALRDTERSLNVAKAREAERIRTQSWAEMARRVAHELKNPLTPMALAADTVAASDAPDVATAGEVLREEIRRLDHLARAFSQLGRPVEGPPSRVDLTELLSALARRLSTEGAPIRIDLPGEPVEVVGHLDALERVARNLVANAQEAHSAARGEPSRPPPPVEVRLTRTGEGGAEIRVLDRGPGVPDEILDRIWEPEFTTKRRGTGLGLALVRQAILAHGGEVSARNRDGGGAEFVVRLPADFTARTDGGAPARDETARA